MGLDKKNHAEMGLKLIVACPANAITGGPEALHQLVHTANEINPNSSAIWYLPDGHHNNPEPYKHYNCPTIQRHNIPPSAIIVLPEIWPAIANDLPNRKALWWLSVNNFGTHGQQDTSQISLHLCQSEYAHQHLPPDTKKLMLTDWVEIPSTNNQNRSVTIAVNPAKNAGLLDPFIQNNPHLKYIQLAGYNRQQLSEILHNTLIYIDFGHHPGRDRFPREAALAGCIIISTNLGAAKYYADMPLHPIYKFTNLEELNQIVNDIIANPTQHQTNQTPYRKWVEGQRDIFRSEVAELLNQI